MRSSRFLTAFGLGALLLLGACSSSKSSDTTTIASETGAETTVAETTVAAESTASADTTAAAETSAAAVDTTAASASGAVSGDSFAGALAKSFQEASGSTLTDKQTACVSSSILSAFTEKELVALGQSAGGFDALSDADKAKAVASFQKCPGVLEEAFFAGFKQSLPGLDETQGRCGATAIGKAFTPEELVKLSSSTSGAASAQDPAVLTKVFKAFETCNGLLQTLLSSGIKQSGASDAEAACAADAMIKAIGVETLVKISTDPSSVDPADQQKLVTAMSACKKP